MKKIRLQIFLILLLFATSLAYVSAQPPLPDDPKDGQPLPVGNGMVILAGLAAAYGAGKVFIMKKKQK